MKNKLILNATIPALSPIKIDTIKVPNIIKETHHPGGAPYSIVA